MYIFFLNRSMNNTQASSYQLYKILGFLNFVTSYSNNQYSTIN